MSKELVTVQGLTKEFIPGAPAVKDVSFTVEEGRSLGILGKSGSGKSVILWSLKGVKGYEPTSGKILFRIALCKGCYWTEPPKMVGGSCPNCGGALDESVVDYWQEALRYSEIYRSINRRIGIMRQRAFGLYGNDLVVNNIIYALAQAGVPAPMRVKEATLLLDEVQMLHRAHHVANDLSGGEKQRVILAMQLAKKPMILLADEPTGTLDIKTAELVHDSIKRFQEKRSLLLVITSHWPHVIEELSDQSILLEDGVAVAQGSFRDVASRFLGSIKEVKGEYSASANPMLKVEGIQKYYITYDRGVVKAVDGISFQVNEGEILGLVGKSGAGKTSLVKIIAGLLTPSEGKVTLRVGESWIDATNASSVEIAKVFKSFGFLHQEYGLYPHRTIFENLTTSIGLSLPAEMAEANIIDIFEALGFTPQRIPQLLEKLPGELSEGEKQRVALARALIKGPPIVILDEPTGTLDPLTRQEVALSIKSAQRELGQTFLVVSHDEDFVKEVCDRTLKMSGGKITAEETPKTP